MLEYLNDNYECGCTTVKAAAKPHDLRLKALTTWTYFAEQNFAICVHSATESQAAVLSRLRGMGQNAWLIQKMEIWQVHGMFSSNLSCLHPM